MSINMFYYFIIFNYINNNITIRTTIKRSRMKLHALTDGDSPLG